MSQRSVDVVRCEPAMTAEQFIAELLKPRSAAFVLIEGPSVTVPPDAREAMVDAAMAPMAATVSPVPTSAAPDDRVVVLSTDHRLPPTPTLAIGCADVCLVSREALSSIGEVLAGDWGDWRAAFARLGQLLREAGWRHVAAPGTALDWTPDQPPHHAPANPTWSPAAVAAQNGPANEGLAAHALWVSTRLRPARIVVDGACLTDAPHNGSQAVVVHVARALRRTRPQAVVALAVPVPFVDHVAGLVAADGVEVIARDGAVSGFDLVYRPYQLLDPGELSWLADAAQRLVVGQLDMIAFSNPAYHPSAALFHAVRNLQRHTMRYADGVTFISEFAMGTALAECPDIDHDRCFVVSCGVDVTPPAAARPTDTPAELDGGRFIACTSATFWHKNRAHALAVFADLCGRRGYDGHLAMAGPEPFYGRSTEAEQQLIRTLEPDVRRRVHFVGQVDEATKWWLLERAELVLYPSIVEGFGLVPFEAAAVGTPSLSHDGSALSEVVGEGPALVRSWDVAAWSDAAWDLIGSPERAVEAVETVRRAGARHGWDRTALLTWDAFDAALARPRASRHDEEGGWRSRVATDSSPLAPGARVTHLGNRLVSYAERQVRSRR